MYFVSPSVVTWYTRGLVTSCCCSNTFLWYICCSQSCNTVWCVKVVMRLLLDWHVQPESACEVEYIALNILVHLQYSSLQCTIRTSSTVSIDGHKAEPWTVVLDSHRNQSGILSVPVDTYCSHSVSVCQKQILVRNVCNQFTMKFIPDFQLELVNRSEICQIKYRTFKNVAHVYTFYSK